MNNLIRRLMHYMLCPFWKCWYALYLGVYSSKEYAEMKDRATWRWNNDFFLRRE